MAKSRPSVQKRLKEARVLEKKQAKAARKAAREAELAAQREENEELDDDIDPDLVGIKPGPHNHRPWLEEG